MNEKSKIKQLWQYLQIQDEEILIIKVYRSTKDTDEYVIAHMVNGALEIETADDIQHIISEKPFRLIKQRDNHGRHIIPSVTQLENDKLADY